MQLRKNLCAFLGQRFNQNQNKITIIYVFATHIESSIGKSKKHGMPAPEHEGSWCKKVIVLSMTVHSLGFYKRLMFQTCERTSGTCLGWDQPSACGWPTFTRLQVNKIQKCNSQKECTLSRQNLSKSFFNFFYRIPSNQYFRLCVYRLVSRVSIEGVVYDDQQVCDTGMN